MAKRYYYKPPKKNLTDEEIEAWAAQVFENLMSNIETDEAEPENDSKKQ